MRTKSNIGLGRSTPPEAFPDVLQDALYSDDYVLQMAEQNMIVHLLTRARLISDQMDKVRRSFILKGGQMELVAGGMKLSINDNFVFVSPEKYDSSYTKKAGESVRKLLRAAMRAYLQEYRIERAIKNLERYRDLMLGMHLTRGVARIAEAGMEIPTTLDEMARGHIVWDDEDAS